MTELGPLSQHNSKENASNYKLCGIIHHKGTLDSGHYFAEVMDFDSKDWFKCDDSNIKNIKMPKEPTETAYVVFYIKE